MPGTSFTAGDTFSDLVSLSAYPATSGWALKQRLVPVAGGTAIGIDAVADGDAFLLTVAATSTKDWAPGAYTWSRWVERAAESYIVASGQLQVLPDPRIASGDLRTPTRRALDDARAAWRSFDPTRKRYRIGDREMEFNSATELVRKISELERQVAIEEGASASKPAGGRFYFR